MKVFINGLLTGLILQTAIGAVFFFIINLALQRSLYDGLVAVVAVTLVDYFYISLAILGIGKLLVFGLSVGLATLLFMGVSVILFSLVKKTVPISLIQTLNIIESDDSSLIQSF